MVNEARLSTIDEEPVPVVTVRLERIFYGDGDQEDDELRKTYDKKAIREVILAILDHIDQEKLLPFDETNNNLYHKKVKLGSGTRLSFVVKLQTSLTFGDLKNADSIRAALSKWKCSMYHHRLNVYHGLDARLIFNLFGVHPFHVNKMELETKIDQTIKTYVNEKASETQKKTWGSTFCKWIKETSDTVVEIGVRNWAIDHKEADQKRLRFPVKVLTMRVEGRFVTQMRSVVSAIEWKRKMLGILVDEFSDDYTLESLEKLAYSHHQFIQESAYIHLSWMPEGVWNIRLPDDQKKTVEELLFDATITVGGIKKRLFRFINKIKESTGLYYLITTKTLLRDAETFAMQLMEKVNATKEFQEDKSLDNPEEHCIIVGRKTDWDKERALLQRKKNSVNMTAIQMNHGKRTTNKVSADRTVSETIVASRSDDTVTNDKSIVVTETETIDVEPTPAAAREVPRASTSNDSTDQETSTETKNLDAGGKDDTTRVEPTKATEMQPESCDDCLIPSISGAELAVKAPSSTPFATLFEEMMPGLETHFEEIRAQLQLMKEDYKNVRVQKQLMNEDNENVRAQNKHLNEECEERRARHFQLLLLWNEKTKLLKDFGVILPTHVTEKDNSIMIDELLFMVQSMEAQNKRLEAEHDIVKRERDELIFVVNEQTRLLKQNGVKASLAWIDKTISLTWMEQYNKKIPTESDKARGTQNQTPKAETKNVESLQAKAVQATSRSGSAIPSKLKNDNSVMVDELLRRVHCLEAQNQLVEDEHARIRSQHDQILLLLNEQTRMLEYKMKPMHQENTRVPSPPTILRHSHGPPIVGCTVKSTTDTIAAKNQ